MMTDGSASSSSVASTPSNKRKRKSPLGLQVNVACFFYKLTADATVFFFSYRVKSELFTDLWMMTVSYTWKNRKLCVCMQAYLQWYKLYIVQYSLIGLTILTIGRSSKRSRMRLALNMLWM